MEQDLFTNLPPEMMIDILSTLPIRTITRCKCVCKSWCNFVETSEFVKSHLSKSILGPALYPHQGETRSEPYKILEFVDPENSGHRCDIVFGFSFPRPGKVYSSANGLFFMFDNVNKGAPYNLFICNPITREYMKLPPPMEALWYVDAFGFGVSKLSCQYKVVRIFRDVDCSTGCVQLREPSKCEVYTLGTGSWRSIPPGGGPLRSPFMTFCVPLNGNLHWFVSAGDFQPPRILSFDLEDECFSTFSSPVYGYHGFNSLCALGDCLCLCDSSHDHIVIWLMKKYGDDKSWKKELKIKVQNSVQLHGIVEPIKIFGDGDILFTNEFSPIVYCCSSKTKTIRKIDVTEWFDIIHIRTGIYSPTFLSLKTFAMENVTSF